MLAFTEYNDTMMKVLANKISRTTSKYETFLHDDNIHNYIDVAGIRGACWQYAQYFNLIEQYIDRGKRTIKTVGDIGCGVGLGYLTFKEFFSHLDVEFISLKRNVGYVNKYDHLLEALEVPYVDYYGNFELTRDPPVFPQVNLDVGIAHRVVLGQPTYDWSIMKPLFAPGGLLLTTDDQEVFRFNIKHVTFK